MDPAAQIAADHQFYLTLAGMLFSFLGTAIAGYIAYLSTKAKADREAKQTETRENMGQLARGLQGIKTASDASIAVRSSIEGAKFESERVDSPESDRRAIDRREELIEAERKATVEASATMKDVEKKILEVPPKP